MTKYNNFKFDDVEIGDGVYFDDVYSGKYLTQSNYDEYWEVTGKNEKNVMLNLKHLGQDHYWTIRYDEIRQLEKSK
jgi:hypothetical protein